MTDSLLGKVKNWLDETLLGFKRRGINKTERLTPVLRFLDVKFIQYDTVVFIKHDADIVKKLKETGFIQEDRCRYTGSSFTLFWEEFVLELEVVQVSEWEELRRCINISNSTNFFDLNVIREAMNSEANI